MFLTISLSSDGGHEEEVGRRQPYSAQYLPQLEERQDDLELEEASQAVRVMF
jgi:hypothetical protein